MEILVPGVGLILAGSKVAHRPTRRFHGSLNHSKKLDDETEKTKKSPNYSTASVGRWKKNNTQLPVEERTARMNSCGPVRPICTTHRPGLGAEHRAARDQDDEWKRRRKKKKESPTPEPEGTVVSRTPLTHFLHQVFLLNSGLCVFLTFFWIILIFFSSGTSSRGWEIWPRIFFCLIRWDQHLFDGRSSTSDHWTLAFRLNIAKTIFYLFFPSANRPDDVRWLRM